MDFFIVNLESKKWLTMPQASRFYKKIFSRARREIACAAALLLKRTD